MSCADRPRCPVCGSPEAARRYRITRFEILGCRACDQIYLDPMPESGEIRELFRQLYSVGTRSARSRSPNRRPICEGPVRGAALLQRVFEIDALRCPRCGSTMRRIAAIEDPDVARRILECLKLPARAPPLGDATAAPEQPVWPEDDWFFDQSPTCEEA